MKKILILISFYFVTLNCTKKTKVFIEDQFLNYKMVENKSFKITLTTVLRTEKNIQFSDLKNFYILHQSDTLHLKFLEIKNDNNIKLAYFETKLKNQKEFESYYFIDSVKNYHIQNKSTHIIVTKSPTYSLKITQPLEDHKCEGCIE